MRFYEALAILVLLVSSFILGVYTGINHGNPYPIYGLIILTFFVIYSLPWITSFIERSALSYATKQLLFMGRGVPSSLIKTQIILAELGLLGFLLSLGYLVSLGPRAKLSTGGIILVVSFLGVVVISLVMIRLRGVMTISSRKTSVEVEFPFLLALMRALSETHLSLYDLLNIIGESQSLKAWAREVNLAKRLSGAMGLSLFQTISVISDTHPSKLVRDTFKRIVIVGNLSGTIRDVVERTFAFVYNKLDNRLNRLTDNLDMINGVLMFGFMFTPILMAIMAPLSRMSSVGISIMIMAIEVPTAILMYAVLTAVFPSGFTIKPSTGTTILATFSILLVFVVTGIYMGPILSYSLSPHSQTEYLFNPPKPSMSIEVYTTIVTGLLLPPAIVGELLYRRVNLYSTLIKITTDVAEVSASLGENFITLFTRESHRYGKSARTLVRSIIEGYQTPIFRKVIVSKAPTIFHASFLETLLYTLMIGAPATVLKGLTESYESLTKIWDKTRSISRTVEGMILSLSGVLGFFLEYMHKIFMGFAQSIHSATRNGGATFISSVTNILSINPTVFVTLSAITSISIVVVSLMVGKTRGGSLIFGFRTALIAFLIYQTATILVTHMVNPSLGMTP